VVWGVSRDRGRPVGQLGVVRQRLAAGRVGVGVFCAAARLLAGIRRSNRIRAAHPEHLQTNRITRYRSDSL
jgi:hypothetical protein